MNGLYLDASTAELFKRTIAAAAGYGYTFPNGANPPSFESAKAFYHGNSKLLLHLFYNEITGGREMRITTRATELTYPQIKRVWVQSIDKRVLW